MHSKRLQVSLWVAQALLALAFLAAGAMKLLTPSDELTRSMGLSAGLIRFIGAAELLGALGLILPAVTGVKPRLSALAALGLALVMFLATCFHLMRGELSHLGPPLLLGGLAAFVVWGRVRGPPMSSVGFVRPREDRHEPD
jgi:putative oxidoreductase